MRGTKIKVPVNDRQSELRRLRMAREEAQRSAGIWGEMSVALISKNGSVFVHCLKGNRQPDLYSFAVKKPKEWADAEYDALMAWLRANKFEGFTQSFTAWNLSQAESQKVKEETLAKLKNDGRTAINPAAANT
jgi:hypothetical protein